MCPPPPSGLSGVPYCLFPGAAGLPLTSRREDLLSRGLRDSRLSPRSSRSCGLMPSRSPGLSVPLPAPRSCSIPLVMLRGALGTVFGAGSKEKNRCILPWPWQETRSVCTKAISQANISSTKHWKKTLLFWTCTDYRYVFSFFFF